MTAFLYPSNAELQEIEQDLLPDLLMTDPSFEIMPIETEDTDLVMWEQEDNYPGLAQAGALNSEANKVDAVGFNRYRLAPGYYREFMLVDEEELTRRRKIGDFSQPIDITDLVRKRQDQLLHRRVTRLKYINWTLLATGSFTVAAPGGGTVHSDSYPTQTFTSSVHWFTSATATPLADFRTAQLLQRGHSVTFGRDATAYMNLSTWNNMIANTNSADLYGRRTAGFGTYENVQDVNKLLTGDNLPTIQIYDGNYLDANGNVQLYIPNNTVVLVGKRLDKRPIAKYVMTRNAAAPGLAPGPFVTVVDTADCGQPIPRNIKVYDSHNGGPAILYPSAVVVMNV